MVGDFCQALEGSDARLRLAVRKPFVSVWRRGGHDIEKSEFGSELIGSCNGLRQAVERCGSEVSREQKCRVPGGRSKPGAAIGVRPDGQDRTICMTEDLFRNRAEEHLANAFSTMRADDEEISALLPDDLSQFRPQLTLPNDEFVLNAS